MKGADETMGENDRRASDGLGLPTAALADAAGLAASLGAGFHRYAGSAELRGAAVTAWCDRGDSTAMLRALRDARNGDVLCVHGPVPYAYFGELAAAEAVRKGLAGVVVDGYIRDIDRLAKLELVVYARGATPKGAPPAGVGRVGLAIPLGDTIVSPGDLIVGDRDGIVAIHPARVADVTTRAAEIEEVEGTAWQKILTDGLSLFDLPSAYGAPLGERIAEVDS